MTPGRNMSMSFLLIFSLSILTPSLKNLCLPPHNYFDHVSRQRSFLFVKSSSFLNISTQCEKKLTDWVSECIDDKAAFWILFSVVILYFESFWGRWSKKQRKGKKFWFQISLMGIGLSRLKSIYQNISIRIACRGYPINYIRRIETWDTKSYYKYWIYKYFINQFGKKQ